MKEKLVSELIYLLWNTQLGSALDGPKEYKDKGGNVRIPRGREFVKTNREHYLTSSVLGFQGEMELGDAISCDSETLEGGWFVSLKKGSKSALETPIYWTVTSESCIEKYKRLYEILEVSCEPVAMFVLCLKNDADILSLAEMKQNEGSFTSGVSSFSVYRYHDSEFNQTSFEEFSSYFEERDNPITYKDVFEEDNPKLYAKLYRILLSCSFGALKKLYVNRYLFDFLLTTNFKRGTPSDIDAVRYHENYNGLRLIDTKNNYPTRNGKVGRNKTDLAFWLPLEEKIKAIGVKCVSTHVQRAYYVDSPAKIDWKFCSIRKFYDVRLSTTSDGDLSKSGQVVESQLLPLSGMKDLPKNQTSCVANDKL